MRPQDENHTLPMDDQPAKPQYIREQHNHNCQQFFGDISGCVFAMPGSTVHLNQPAAPAPAETPAPPAKPKPRKATPHKPTTCTYTYRWMDKCPERITHLYQGLLSLGWIDSSTKPDTFQALFSGQAAEFRIRWTDSTALLWYLFKLIKDRKYVTRPDGVTTWAIEKSHFVGKDGRVINDWNNQHTPQQHAAQVKFLANLLNPLEPIPER